MNRTKVVVREHVYRGVEDVHHGVEHDHRDVVLVHHDGRFNQKRVEIHLTLGRDCSGPRRVS